MSGRHAIRLSVPAKRALERDLPEKVASAALEFIYGPLAENPYRVGKQLREPLWPRYSARRGEYRVIYTVREQTVTVDVLSVSHRRDTYRA